MQLPTHILTGIVLQKSLAQKKRPALALGLTALLAFLSHGILDKLARVTYHPPSPDFRSPFWVGYHLALLLTTILFLYLWWRQFRWGIAFAILPDLDWVFIHGQEIFHFTIPFYRRPHLHDLLHFIYQRFPFTYLDRLPSSHARPWTCLWELLLIAVLLACSHALTRKQLPYKSHAK